MTLAETLHKQPKNIFNLFCISRNAIKAESIDPYYCKFIYIDGSALEVRFYTFSFLTKPLKVNK